MSFISTHTSRELGQGSVQKGTQGLLCLWDQSSK